MAGKRSFGTIRKLRSGRYQVRYRRHGKQLSSGQTFATKADASAHLSALETDLSRGHNVEPKASRVHLGDYSRTWLEQRDLRPRTRETYESQLKWILERFEHAVLNEITPGDVRAWHADLVRSSLHANSVSKVYRMLRSILTTAVDDGLLVENPVHIRGAARESIVERPLLTWDQVNKLAEAIEPRFSALVWVAASTGLRFGELTGLQPTDLDLDDPAAATVRVQRALAYESGTGTVLGAPKTESAYRTVSIPAPVVHRVVDHIRSFPSEHDVGLVFTSTRGTPLVNGYFAPFWRRARERVGIPGVRFHDLRHLAGTEAASAGASLREVMARMGHSSSLASLRYLKASEQRETEIGDAIARRIAAAAETPAANSPTT